MGQAGQQEPCGALQIDGRNLGVGLRLNLLLTWLGSVRAWS